MEEQMISKLAVAALATGLAMTPAKAGSVGSLAQPSQDWARCWQARDLEATLALYTDDAVFMDAGGSRIAGKPALRKFFAVVLSQYRARPTMHSVESEASGDLGYDWGDYSEVVTPLAKPDGAIQTHGTYLVILKRVAGRWLIAEQMWTGNVPVPVKR
jgi:uncharacterized protein (TIGR02246 family)